MEILKSIKAYFGGIGIIVYTGKDVFQYRITAIDYIKLIINHFDNYPLITQKKADYLLFKQGFYLISINYIEL